MLLRMNVFVVKFYYWFINSYIKYDMNLKNDRWCIFFVSVDNFMME